MTLYNRSGLQVQVELRFRTTRKTTNLAQALTGATRPRAIDYIVKHQSKVEAIGALVHRCVVIRLDCTRLGADVNVILTPPCIFCVDLC